LAYLPELEHIPWIKVNAYLREIGGSTTREQFCETVLSGLVRLIPFDVAGVFQVSGPCLHQIGASEKTMKAYAYYQSRLPRTAPPPGTFLKLNWRTVPYRNSEFVTDFIIPQGLAKSLVGTLPGNVIAMAIHRSSLALDVTDLEYAILDMLAPHVQHFYNCFDKIAKLSRSCPTKEEMAEHFPSLSHREAEVAALLCQGLTFAEIATCLFVSRRTVETHIENIYDKLDVHDKKTAIERLTSQK